MAPPRPQSALHQHGGTEMNRRDFLNSSAAGAGGLLLGLAPDGPPAAFDPYERVVLGRSGLTASRLCLGTGMQGGMRASNHTRMGRARFETLVRGAYERGIRLFDLADIYGTHPFFSAAVAGLPRDSYRVATKIWFRPGALPEDERPDADAVVERFLRELNMAYVDLVLLHCVVSGAWPSELRRQMALLEGLKARGLVRAHGLSCHTLEALEAAVDEPWVDVVYARINAYGTRMDGPPEVVVPVLQRLHAAGKGVVGMKLIGEGAFRHSDEQRDASVRFVLGLGCVDVLNVGFETLDEVDDFAARVRRVPRPG